MFSHSFKRILCFLAADMHTAGAVCNFGIKTDTKWKKSAWRGEPSNCGMSQTLVAARLHPRDSGRCLILDNADFRG